MITCNVALEKVSLLLNVRYEALDQNFFIIKFGIHFSSNDSHDFIINIDCIDFANISYSFLF